MHKIVTDDYFKLRACAPLSVCDAEAGNRLIIVRTVADDFYDFEKYGGEANIAATVSNSPCPRYLMAKTHEDPDTCGAVSLECV